MCSIVEEDFGDEGAAHAMPEDKLIDSNDLPEEICKKCNQDKTVVRLSFKDAQCKNCFLLYVRHKMRATLGASKVVPKNSNILLEFNGSQNNIVLVDMINYALCQTAFKRLHFNVTVLYVDDSFTTETDRIANYNRIKELLNQFQFTHVYYTSLGDQSRLEPFHKIVITNESNTHEIEFAKSLNVFKSLTSKQDYITLTKKRLLYKQSNALGCAFIFTSEISSDLAKTFLTNISLGRGSSVALDVGFIDTRDADIKQIRPIRDLNINEINNYIKLIELDYLRNDITYGKNLGEFASIQNLTDSFIENLQQHFASTVSTVYRTGDKITSDTDAELKCKFCRANIDCNNSNTLFAIKFSRAVSNNPRLINDGKIMDEDMDQIVNTEDENDISKLKSQLCHGCRNIVCDFDGPEDEIIL